MQLEANNVFIHQFREGKQLLPAIYLIFMSYESRQPVESLAIASIQTS